MKFQLVTTEAQFKAITASWAGLLAVDTETYGDLWSPDYRLLGVSISPEKALNGVHGIYIPFHTFEDGLWCVREGGGLLTLLGDYLRASQGLIGHNFTYDKRALAQAGLDTTWHACTRLMYHLAAAPAGPRPYSLEDAQKELLGWDVSNKTAMHSHLLAQGAKPTKDRKIGSFMYMADLKHMLQYACVDTYSTMLVYSKLSGWFSSNEYWPMLKQMMAYNELLERNTFEGIKVDRLGLEKAHNRLLLVKESAKKRFFKELKNEIASIEEDWADRRIADYKRQYNKDWYRNNPSEWKRFNLNSDKDKRELFYSKLGNTIEVHTDNGAPSVSGDAVKRFGGSYVESYLKYEKANTLSTSFSGPYLGASSDGRLHPGFNICGTVSYRLSGFKPYLLNAPFDERNILKNLTLEEGYVGVHADLAAIEPTITAHFSEDPLLLKVFRDGLGDIYLDLALRIFPEDQALREGYNPNIPITSKVKKLFERQRKIAKVIQLAVQYTGTESTVEANLKAEGIPVTRWQARAMVGAYWEAFERVSAFNDQLFALNRKQGHLRNVIGRIIQVPHPDYKDLPNRFIQSSAHDVLVLWVLEIYRLCAERGIHVKPILLDCHDSSSNCCPIDQVDMLKQAYVDALKNINDALGLCVTIKAELKTFTTLAGLKGD
jgi:DNA polymerase I-like protein with 3'-5' exonuclease and polymerase domains